MKHLFSCCLLALLLGLTATPPSQAQAPPPDSARQWLTRLFAPLDRSQLPAPYLEEAGYRLLPLRLFAGQLADSNRTSLSRKIPDVE